MRSSPMVATCLHCSKSLGGNDVLETLPIGRRIAFDAAQGRLWVVCRHCARWNLVPFDTRLETIDAAERLFRDTRTRYSTDNIGLARVPEGLELVRIGAALRPEFAAWRYGDSFGRRRRRAMLGVGAGVAAFVGIAYGLPLVGVGGMGALTVFNYLNVANLYVGPAVRVPMPDAAPVALSNVQLAKAQLIPGPESEWVLRTPTLRTTRTLAGFGLPSSTLREFRGPTARLLLAGILARTNATAGSRRSLGQAVQWVEAHPTLDRVIQWGPEVARQKGLAKLPVAYRLALEMSLHEQSEREALAGELRMLEWQWREAERLAKISDGLAIEAAEAGGAG
ncbi:MAG: hypothetical protein AB7N73_05595 [Gemmatimonadales bacterium]